MIKVLSVPIGRTYLQQEGSVGTQVQDNRLRIILLFSLAV